MPGGLLPPGPHSPAGSSQCVKIFVRPDWRGPEVTHLFCFSCSQGWCWNPSSLCVDHFGIRPSVPICLMMRDYFLWQSCSLLSLCLLFGSIRDAVCLWNFPRWILFLCPRSIIFIDTLLFLFHASSPRMLRFQDKIFILKFGDLRALLCVPDTLPESSVFVYLSLTSLKMKCTLVSHWL